MTTPRTDGLPRPSHFTSGDLAAWIDAAQKRILRLERELAEARADADQLEDALLRTNHDCHELSHYTGEYHEGCDCPVVKLIEMALAGHAKLKEETK